eukprot:228972-Pyramimonas_sp.AAC.1
MASQGPAFKASKIAWRSALGTVWHSPHRGPKRARIGKPCAVSSGTDQPHLVSSGIPLVWPLPPAYSLGPQGK